MGRFSWGIGSKSREMRPSRKETVVDGKVDAPVTVPYTWTSRYMWIVGLGLAAFFGYCMEVMPIRVSNAMWTNHLFSEYKPPRRVHMHLIQSQKSALLRNDTEPPSLWNPPSANGWKPCLHGKDQSPGTAAGENAGFLQIICTGGLFQLHICICNAVAVARMLNVTLVIPHFRQSLVWKDPSQFHDIYDSDHFISYFKEDIQIVRQLPLKYAWSDPEYYENQCLERPNCLTFIPKHSTMSWYFTNVLPILRSHGLAVLDSFDHKLTFEDLPVHITKLRCRANFEGLQFVPPIQELGKRLVTRLRAKGLSHQPLTPTFSPDYSAPQPWWAAQRLDPQDGKSKVSSEGMLGERVSKVGGQYLGLHVRFEKDMIAHSACYYGGGRAEKRALAAFRANIWRAGVSKTKFKPDALRMNGSCPLTPEEMGLLLSGFGFRNHTPIYIASKVLYGGLARIKPLKEMFPLLDSKYTLASKKELRPFLPHAHKLAALDFIVSSNSDVFMSNAAGNFPNVLSGQRTFFGLRKSIHADKTLLAHLFSNTSISWKEFSSQVTRGHESRLGAPVRRMKRYSIYRYPAPDCMCQPPTSP